MLGIIFGPMKMLEMCLDERPREKIKKYGTRSLSNGELLAILLRTGVVGHNVLEVAQALLVASDGKLSKLYSMSPEQMMQIPGIGKDKAVTLEAAFELGRRWMSEPSDIAKVPIRSADLAWRVMAPKLRGLDHEEFWVMLLNRANYVISLEHISMGNISSTSLDVPRILKKVLDKNATGVIMFHNHPSDNPMPGQNDIDATISLKKALEAMDKQLLDHLILSDSGYYSFSQETVIRSPMALLTEG